MAVKFVWLCPGSAYADKPVQMRSAYRKQTQCPGWGSRLAGPHETWGSSVSKHSLQAVTAGAGKHHMDQVPVLIKLGSQGGHQCRVLLIRQVLNLITQNQHFFPFLRHGFESVNDLNQIILIGRGILPQLERGCRLHWQRFRSWYFPT